MQSEQSNEKRLIEAGLLHEDHDLSDDERACLEELTSGEIDALVSARAKLGKHMLNRASAKGSHPPTDGFAF